MLSRMNTRVRPWSGFRCFLSIFLFASCGILQTKSVESSPWVCDDAARDAADSLGIPVEIMRVITRVETGRVVGERLSPWPWAVNMNGQENWLDSKAEALNFVFQEFRLGEKNFDVGCFQINYRWHGGNFSSIEDMFDPTISARYAAEFLKKLFEKHGNWRDAIGAYHSGTPALAKKYLTTFDQVRNTLRDQRSFEVHGDFSSPPAYGKTTSNLGSLVSFSRPGYESVDPLFRRDAN